MREVAAKYPSKAGDALGELAYFTSVVASAFSNLREQLDLAEPPRAASPQARIAARKKFAATFRRVAEANPDQIASAVIELYRNVDEIVAGIENFAANMGIELPEDFEEGGEGMPGMEGMEQVGESLESPKEQAHEQAEGTEGSEADKKEDVEIAEKHEEHEGEETPKEESEEHKEAADTGSSGFVTDRDAEGKPKPPEKAKPSRVATGGAGFVTNRDQSAEPKPVEQAEIPESQGEAAIKLASLREHAGW
jgi:hypothetical protein